MVQALLHLGGYKTGSTSIQRHMHIQRAAYFANERLLYAETGLVDYYRKKLGRPKLFGAGHWRLARDWRGASRGETQPSKDFKVALRDLEVECARAGLSDDDHVLLSSEAFLPSRNAEAEAVEPTLLRGCAAFDAFRVIYYARPQVDAAMSKFKQVIKSPAWKFTGSFDEFVQCWAPTVRYHEVLAPWAALCGAENIVVRPYRRDALVGGDVIDDFTHALGVARQPDAGGTAKRNRSHSLYAALQLREMRRAGTAPSDHGKVIELLAQIDSVVSNEERESLETEFTARNAATFERLRMDVAQDNTRLVRTYHLSEDFFM